MARPTTFTILSVLSAALCLPFIVLSLQELEREMSYQGEWLDGLGYLVALALIAPVMLTAGLTGSGVALRKRAPRTGLGLVIAGLTTAASCLLALSYLLFLY